MKKTIFRSIQFRIIALLLVFMTTAFLASLYTVSYVSKAALMEEKETKLLNIAAYLSDKLGDRTYSDILLEAGVLSGTDEEKLKALNAALKGVTNDVAEIYPGIGVGFYSRALDAIITYGPSEEYGDNVGKPIGADHPGRTVMIENEAMVRRGTMVRGNILNAMHPVERGGEVIGYTWANELTTDIEKEYNRLTRQITVFLSIFFIVAVILGTYFLRITTREIVKIVSGVKLMKGDLSKRILGVRGELSEVAESINGMAEHIEQTNREHEALILAEAANQAQRDFLARMSHEIRTPMNGVLGMTRLAMQAESKEQSLEYMKKIQSSATILLGIINDILDFSKIEANKLELEAHPFIISEVIENIRELILGRVEEKDLSLKINVDSSVPQMAEGDSLKLSQILLNLLGNAVKFTESGAVELNLKASQSRDGRLRLDCEVCDSGIGMSEEQLKLLFKPFSQVDSSMARKFGGTGLGLSISKALIELMDGEITVKSALNEGSSFSFFILLNPFTGTPESEASENSESDENRYAGKKALLAEDIAINQEIAAAVLSEFGFEIDVAQNGEEAVSAFKNSVYDLIFMDIRMPLMDGLEATRQIRRIEAERGTEQCVPIIAMTANAMREDREASRDAGMNGHISKPLDLDEIRDELCKVLG